MAKYTDSGRVEGDALQRLARMQAEEKAGRAERERQAQAELDQMLKDANRRGGKR